MKVLIAPDSFKGSLTALEVCQAAATGIAALDPTIQCELVPMADGGEGTVQALVDASSGELRQLPVTGPLGSPVTAVLGLLGDGETAVIEMATASGLPLVPPELRNPLHTTTYGTGELIRAALDQGRRRLIIGIGGSATNEAGLGVAAALGARLLDEEGAPVPPTGAGLTRLASVDLTGFDPRVGDCEVLVACDVDNPLYGPRGAAHIYGPQKGATPEIVAQLDEGLQRFAVVAERDLGCQVAEMPGAGAAGGLGAGLVAFCGARLERGVRIVVDTVHLRERMTGCQLCLTGEGRLDRQTAFGKTPQGVADVARALGVPVLAFGGSVATDAPELNGAFGAVFSICTGPLSLEEAMDPVRARQLVAFTAQQMVRCYLTGSNSAFS